MRTSILPPAIPQRAAWVTPPTTETLPVRVRAAFSRLRGMFGPADHSAWALSLQPEHLLAYATWSETLADPEGDALSVRANPETIGAT